MSETGESNNSNDKKTAVPVTEAATGDFERQLFRNGTLDFNLDKYVGEANESLERQRQWYGDYRDAAESFARDIQQAHYNLIWQQNFSGKIPRHWDDWGSVQDDCKRSQGVKFTSS